MLNTLSFILIIAVIAAAGWRAPLSARRRAAVLALRLIAVVCLWLAIKGWSWPHHVERARQIVYLVDQSASMQEDQTRAMAARVASLEARRPHGMPRTVMAFGSRAAVVVPSGTRPLDDPTALAQALRTAAIPREATNLESAILAAIGAGSSPASTRVILMTDGRQTAGRVERALGYVRRLGLEVYPVTIAPLEPTSAVWDQLVAPSVVQPGSSAQLKCVLTNGTASARPIEIVVDFEGLTIARQRAILRPGWQVIPVSVPALKTGTMKLDVSIAGLGDDPRQDQPRRRQAFVEVEGRPQVLLVVDHPTEVPLLGTALKRRQMDLALQAVSEMPTDVTSLMDYDAVVLFHVTKSALAAAQVAALQDYVERFGGGLMLVGLGGRLNEELARDAPLDALLPVRFEPKGLQEAKRRVCMVMLIDRSASMMGPRIAATKRAAVELVKQLAPEDLVGVLAFDTMPYVVAEVQPASQVTAQLIDKLVRLKSSGGTDFLPAIKAAQARLQASGATVKHVMLLSDGNAPFDARVYGQLLTELRTQRITMSTVGIGSMMVNTDLLGLLASETGGTFYQMLSLDELPQLVARDTQQALGHLPFTEGYFRPEAPPTATWFEGIREWPPLKGYLTATSKPEAILELGIRQHEVVGAGANTRSADAAPTIEAIHPLLAWWPKGKGRVAACTSDADTRWMPDWVRWPYFESVWAQALRSIMRTRIGEELFVWLDEQADAPHLVIEGQLADPTASLISPKGAVTPLSLVQASPFRWRAAVGQLDPGWYQLLVESQASTKFAKRWVQLGSTPEAAELGGVPPDELLLSRIAQVTGGYLNVPDRAFVPPSTWVQQQVSLRMWLLPLAIVALLLDVALRGRTLL